jgi:hypothetical protein
MQVTKRWMLMLLLTLLAACASASERSRSNTNVLTREEMSSVDVSNVYEAVARLRPRWLQVRAQRSFNTETEIVVYLNQSYIGDPDVLRTFVVSNVVQLRYLDAATAQATLSGLGSRTIEGAIVVEVSSGGD